MSRRILLINPNTSAAITALVAGAMRAVAPPDLRLEPVTAAFGPSYIGSRAQAAVAAHAAVDALARALAGGAAAHDGAILACFGDPGLDALREMAPWPVAGMAEAAMRRAAAAPGRFAILTGGSRWVAMLEELAASLGLADRLAGVRAVPQTGADIAADPDRALAELAAQAGECAARDGAARVIVGGAGLAGIARRLADRVAVPLIDSVEATMAEIDAATRAAARPARPPVPPVESIGLSPELAAFLRAPPSP